MCLKFSSTVKRGYIFIEKGKSEYFCALHLEVLHAQICKAVLSRPNLLMQLFNDETDLER